MSFMCSSGYQQSVGDDPQLKLMKLAEVVHEMRDDSMWLGDIMSWGDQ